MIITLTANPSIDRTETLDAPLTRGGVHRVGSVTVQAAGKGVNVARVIHEAGVPVLALLPAMPGDPMLQALDQVGLAYRTVAMNGRVRTNLTLTEPDGTTTKINEPGPELDGETVAALAGLVEQNSAGADWAVLSGSLPQGCRPTGMPTWSSGCTRWAARWPSTPPTHRCWPWSTASPRPPPTC